MSAEPFTGGCQCGAVRFRAARLGRPSICHCRMCQKQFGSFFGAFVTAFEDELAWTRGTPAFFRSSQTVERGFCARCGTPLAYRHDGGIELSIGSFDHPEALEPKVQVNFSRRLPWIERLFERPLHESEAMTELHASVISWQHPDHDTDQWPPERQT
ncbi:GFA family protein [Nitratireductor thuwali]|uniref:CENP-V/GFA domain-containing protein n=1 Tax=Nitratireductor thuwali TaxID=2267699 RepID=A0ABY5MT50_9HYPH|nr:hypothetical protein NTH_03503 [Nitratireductor thuwali]